PDLSKPLPRVVVNINTVHPLLYRKRVEHVDSAVRPGDWVAVYHGDQELLGFGIYNPRAEIAVRMFRWGQEPPDEAFWLERLKFAVQLRQNQLRLGEVTDCYRLIHAEADGFSGLVVDRIGDTLSAEAFSLGMYQRAPEIVQRLSDICGTQHWLIRAA